MSESIQITANGETLSLAPGTSLQDFLATRGQAIGRVVVEYNGAALAPSESESVSLRDGDRLEIVRIVAGG